MLANVHRREGVKPFGPMDFCPYLKPREEPAEMDPAQFLAQLRKEHGR